MGGRVGTCEFCGRGPVRLNDEHVWPQWMGGTLLEQMHRPNLRIQRGHRLVHTTTRGIRKLNITAACAGTCCNGSKGWMSRLETQASLFMKPMILRGAETPLSMDRQALLAAWAVKTAMTHEFTDQDRNVYFRRAERLHVKQWLQPPDGVWIWLGRSNCSSQAHSFPILLERTDKVTSDPSAYALTFIAGQFLFQLFAYRRPEWRDGDGLNLRRGLFTTALMRLWPQRKPGGLLIWPPAEAINDDSIGPLIHRFHAASRR